MLNIKPDLKKNKNKTTMTEEYEGMRKVAEWKVTRDMKVEMRPLRVERHDGRSYRERRKKNSKTYFLVS